MRNTVNNHNNTKDKIYKKLFNIRVEKLVREASDNFIYFKDYELALEQVNEALSIEPDHVKSLILKANILLCMDKEDDALIYIDEALRSDPFYAEAYGLKAGILDILGKQKDALVHCEKAFENITLNERHLLASLYDQKIAILFRMKKFEEAREVLKKCTKYIPEEDVNYLMSCYQGLLDASCKEKQRKQELVAKISMKLVY